MNPRGENLVDHRRALVCFAMEHGVKPAAREFKCSPNTVRKWLRRYQRGGPESLCEESRAPKHLVKLISQEQRFTAIQLKVRHPTWGANRIKKTLSLKISPKALRRLWWQYGIDNPPRSPATALMFAHLRDLGMSFVAITTAYRKFFKIQMPEADPSTELFESVWYKTAGKFVKDGKALQDRVRKQWAKCKEIRDALEAGHISKEEYDRQFWEAYKHIRTIVDFAWDEACNGGAPVLGKNGEDLLKDGSVPAGSVPPEWFDVFGTPGLVHFR